MDMPASAALEGAGSTRQFVAVGLGDRHYVIDIYSVREIRGWTSATPVPDSPPAIIGIVNLRGAIVPIIDVQICFGEPQTNPDSSHVVVIVSIKDQLVGLLVDTVSDIITVGTETLQEMPSLDRNAGPRIVPEVVNHDGRLLGVIDLERLVDREILSQVTAVRATSPATSTASKEILPAAQVALVQESFAKVVPIAAQAAEMFYDRLFQLDPELRPLFKGDMKEQGKKLMSALGVVVSNLKQPEKIIGTIQEMGKRHGGYGVKAPHYDTVGQALLWTLEQGLGPAFTPETRAAWAAAYGVVADTMKKAA